MEHYFELRVRINGEVTELPARFFMYGYTHRFEVDINGDKVLFEPDEEGSYRALFTPQQVSTIRVDTIVLEVIVKQLKSIRGV